MIPKGNTIPVKGHKDCILSIGMAIKDVLYIPDFACNLLLVSKLSNELEYHVTFFPKFCVMYSQNSKELIGSGEYERGLYKMGMVENKRQTMMKTPSTWHK